MNGKQFHKQLYTLNSYRRTASAVLMSISKEEATGKEVITVSL